MNALQIPDQELVSIHRCVELRDITVTGWEELSKVNQHVVLQPASWTQVFWWLMRRDIRSCVYELTSALQALEVGVLQDAVDLQVGHQACSAGQV